MSTRSIRFAVGLVAVAALPFGGCSAGFEEDGSVSGEEGGELGELGEEIRNGSITTPWATGSTDTYGKAIVAVGGCTGTVVQPGWVLTAKHCLPGVGGTVVSKRPSGNVSRTIDAVVHNLDPDRDTTMVHLSSNFTDIPQVALFSGTTANIVGNKVTCYGYGAKATGNACTQQSQCGSGEFCSHWGVCMTPSAELRTAELDATALNADIFQTPQNAWAQTILPGDSGGSCRRVQALAGVNSYGNLSGGAQASLPASRDFVSAPSRQMYTPGDFNGDGKTDVIITNASGSYWYYSTGVGTWNAAYTRTDLPLGSVMYTPGDFNGDGKTDVIITTPGGSYWYYSTGTGTWNAAYTRTDLPLHSVQYSAADFNGDGKADVIISNTTGSYWYYSTGTGTWNAAYTRTDLPSNLTDFVTGDFNGDGKKDVIIQNATGSYWYYSTGTGTWNAAYSRTDLPTQIAEYTPGDFNGDGKTDVIIVTAGGSYWYYSTGTGTWNAAYTRTDLPLGSVSYTPADFNGDGKHDVIISNSSGSYWYYSTGTGTWNAAYTRTDLPRYATLYSAGDFSGDGKKDVIIWNTSGSHWYYSTGTGTWNAAYSRTDLPK